MRFVIARMRTPILVARLTTNLGGIRTEASCDAACTTLLSCKKHGTNTERPHLILSFCSSAQKSCARCMRLDSCPCKLTTSCALRRSPASVVAGSILTFLRQRCLPCIKEKHSAKIIGRSCRQRHRIGYTMRRSSRRREAVKLGYLLRSKHGSA